MERSRTGSSLELFVSYTPNASRPFRPQLEEQLREAIRSGRLPAESGLPSSRTLARQLGVSRGIVVEAYEQLGAEGYLISRAGSSTRVAHGAARVAATMHEPPVVPIDVDFRPGAPDLGAFPRGAWLASVRSALATAPSNRLGYLDGRGVPELREGLAAYLNRVRATAADPANTLVCAGFAQGLKLVADVLRAAGARRIGLEDPCLPQSAAIVRAAGHEVIGLPVDTDGIRVDLLADADPDAVLVTPAHQYPTGAVLSPERRTALVAWAARRGAYIIEDDYDAEFRYDREPIGALQGLDPELVIYAGSASKILAPGLRLGWLVAPAAMVKDLARAKSHADMGSPALDQLAFADFIGRGQLERHLRRMRPIYRRRRDVLIAALARHLPALTPTGTSAGLHLLTWLPTERSEEALVQSAAIAGIGLDGVGLGRFAPNRRGGLIFGYGSIEESAIEAGIERIASFDEAGCMGPPDSK